MIPMTGSLRTAHAILVSIQAILPSDRESFDAWVEVFDNCREQGYVIKQCVAGGRSMNIAFAEMAGSDSIVVRTYFDTNHPSNLPKDWTKVNSRIFSPDEFVEAAHFIIGVMREHAPRKENQA